MSTYQPTDEDYLFVEKIFTYHPPVDGQPRRYTELRQQAHVLAERYIESCPQSPELTLAIRYLQQSIMFANAAIAINE